LRFGYAVKVFKMATSQERHLLLAVDDYVLTDSQKFPLSEYSYVFAWWREQRSL